MHANAARSGFDSYQRAAAADLARDVVVILGSLSGHLAVCANTARTCLGIERERCRAGPQFDAAGAGIELPLSRRRSAHLD